LRTFDYTGLYRYFLTFCTDSRRQLFTTSRVVDLVTQQIERTAEDEHFAILAYCFMPDHVHVLIEALDESANCRRFISRAKQFLGFAFARTHGSRLWQRYSYEHVLRTDEATLSVARYILENPLRAKLVGRIEDYPFAGSTVYTLEQILTAVAYAPRTSA
jgi:putative transposase